ncbi:hypothetical protein SERLA73DRAFT_189221 [Serpula lacrymans var. lacrymans S7.3]|uniref:Uncharacterized protein n=2 Tax=Serpula lacrymans var. lacrymans TaxID=341189 RepID=F8QD56_SERL3|nr:uncharacterized protein SERLADRAFT_479940 [Serpula lacrymans var. lacrymans S7.9]EGN93527.1 hypothetical protein SERLA73DRAFT_189221 [Serpula lacrymans var. lacrymans S7.3]EGO18902.1 hypothetical protein SERLADRAFT_479940 [Serpula lacrymans var. lacrymans S7.9]
MSSNISTLGWPESLKRILQPAIQGPTTSFSSGNANLRSSKQPLGVLWKAALTSHIFEDLSSGLNYGRRVLRLDYFGLQSVVLFEYPGIADGDTEDADDPLDLSTVFGDLDSPQDESISVDQLIFDLVSAKLVYVPSYACTSFVTGQVIHAYLFSPESYPRPTKNGFVVHPGSMLKTSVDVPFLRNTTHLVEDTMFIRPLPCLDSDDDDNRVANTSISTTASDSPGPSTPLNLSFRSRPVLLDYLNSAHSIHVNLFKSPPSKVSQSTTYQAGTLLLTHENDDQLTEVRVSLTERGCAPTGKEN